eukprot:UN03832
MCIISSAFDTDFASDSNSNLLLDQGNNVKINTDESTPLPKPELTLTQMWSTLNCWLLFICGTYMIGAGIMLTTNLSQMVESLEYSNVLSASITIFSVSQACGRVCIGFVSEYT